MTDKYIEEIKILDKIGPNEGVLDLIYKQPNLNHLGDGWFAADGLNYYAVNIHGKLKNLVNGELVKSFNVKRGHLVASLMSNSGKFTIRQLHRIVLSTFRPVKDSHNYMVNHKDGNPENNRLDNLEWCTHSQNKQHARTKHVPHFSEDLPVGVCCRNIDTGEYLEFTRVDECAAYFGLGRDSIIERLNEYPMDRVYPGGWQFKRRQDTRKWKDIKDLDLMEISWYRKRPLVVLDYETKEEFEFPGLGEASKFVKVKLTTLCLIVNRQEDELKPFLSRSGDTYKVYQIRYKYDNKPWKTYPTYNHALEAADGSIRIVILITREGKIIRFINLKELSKFTGIGVTTCHYRLLNARKRKYAPWPDGFIYCFFSEYYEDVLSKQNNDNI